MKDFLDLVKKRKTTFEYSSKSVSDKDIQLMLEAARWAPSCTNSQPWHFIIVKNSKQIDKLMKAANYGFFHENPKLIIACVLLDDLCAGPNYACFRTNDSHVYDTFMSVGIAANTICLEAEDLGISSALLTPSQKEVKEILKVEKKDSVPLLVALGYEKSGAFVRKRVRNDLKKIISKEYFGGK